MHYYAEHGEPHSFPTRRSSDLCSNVPLWKLRVGSVPKRLNVSRFVAVPSSRYFAVAGPNERFERSRLNAVSSDRKSTRLNSSHSQISYAVICLKKKNPSNDHTT